MLKKVFVSLFMLGVLFSGIFGTENIITPTVQASGALVYHDSNYLVTVEKVYKKSDVNIDTDVTFMIHSEFSVKETHYEFLKKDGTWLFRTHLAAYGHWAPVSRDNIAQAIFDYAFYNS